MAELGQAGGFAQGVEADPAGWRADHPRAQRHAQDLRLDGAAFRLGPAAEVRLREGSLGLFARPSAALAGARKPGFDLPSRCAEQAFDPPIDRGKSPPRGTGAGRARRRWQAGALGAPGGAADIGRRRLRTGAYSLAVRSARHPAQADRTVLRIWAS